MRYELDAADDLRAIAGIAAIAAAVRRRRREAFASHVEMAIINRNLGEAKALPLKT